MQLRNFLSNEKLFFLIRVFNNIYIKRKSWKQKEKDRIIVCKFFALFIRNTKKKKKNETSHDDASVASNNTIY